MTITDKLTKYLEEKIEINKDGISQDDLNEKKLHDMMLNNNLKKYDDVLVDGKAGYVLKAELQDDEVLYTIFYKYPHDYNGIKRKSNKIGVYKIDELQPITLNNANQFDEAIQDNIKEIYSENISKYCLESIDDNDAIKFIDYFLKNKIKPNSSVAKTLISDYFSNKFKF
jgi:hypothetical protein